MIVRAAVFTLMFLVVYLAVSIIGVGRGGDCHRFLCTMHQEIQSEWEEGE